MRKVLSVVTILFLVGAFPLSAQLVLWNKLGSSTEVQNSEVGPDGTVGGAADYLAAQHGNGTRVNGNGEYIQFFDVNGDLLASAGCLEVWVKPDGWSTVNGVTSDSDWKWIWQTWEYTNSLEQFGFDLALGPGNGFCWNVFDGTSYSGFANSYCANFQVPGLNLQSGVLSHLAFVWDSAGIGNTADTCRIYMDGQLLLSTANVLNIVPFQNVTYRLGNSGVNYGVGTDDFRGTFDNLKIWNYAKTNFADRFVEGIVVNSSPVVAVTEPNGTGDTADTSYQIKYTASDADDTVTVSLYYDNNNTGFDGTLIVNGLPESADGSYVWNTTALPNGNYYVYAVVNDGVNPAVQVYSTGAVTVSHPPAGLILWNKLGSATEVQNSEVGPDGTIHGSALFVPGRFGNAIQLGRTTGDSHVAITNGLPNGNLFTVEMWVTTPYAIPSGMPMSMNMCLFSATNSSDKYCGAVMSYIGQMNGFSSIHSYDYESLYKWDPYSWPANEWHHMAFVFNKDAGSAKYIKFYFDGVLQTVDSMPDNSTWSSSLPMLLFLGIAGQKGNWPNIHEDVTLDNLKVWNFAKTNFDDRFVEGTGVNSSPVVAVTEPNGTGDTADTSYQIKYTASDSDETVTVSLYYDNNNTGFDGTLIVNGLPESADGSYVWNTTALPNGNYYVYAVVNDGVNPAVRVYSTGTVTVSHSPATNSLFQGPGAFKAVANNKMIRLTWNPVSGAVKYKIYRKNTSGVNPIPGNLLYETVSTSYDDKAVEDETRYYYVVTAVNSSSDESLPSTEAWAVAGEKDKKIIIQNNKFDPEKGESVTVKFKTSTPVKVKFRIFAIDGSLVYETQEVSVAPGEHQTKWAGISTNLKTVPPGVYILQVVIDGRPGDYEKVIVGGKK